jgi:hypothetical protein
VTEQRNSEPDDEKPDWLNITEAEITEWITATLAPPPRPEPWDQERVSEAWELTRQRMALPAYVPAEHAGDGDMVIFTDRRLISMVYGRCGGDGGKCRLVIGKLADEWLETGPSGRTFWWGFQRGRYVDASQARHVEADPEDLAGLLLVRPVFPPPRELDAFCPKHGHRVTTLRTVSEAVVNFTDRRPYDRPVVVTLRPATP